MNASTTCLNCGRDLDESRYGPCPNCGSTDRNIALSGTVMSKSYARAIMEVAGPATDHWSAVATLNLNLKESTSDTALIEELNALLRRVEIGMQVRPTEDDPYTFYAFDVETKKYICDRRAKSRYEAWLNLGKDIFFPDAHF